MKFLLDIRSGPRPSPFTPEGCPWGWWEPQALGSQWRRCLWSGEVGQVDVPATKVPQPELNGPWEMAPQPSYCVCETEARRSQTPPLTDASLCGRLCSISFPRGVFSLKVTSSWKMPASY